MNHVTPINSVSEYDSSMHAGEVRAIILAGGIGTARCPAMNSYSSLLFPFLDGEPLICHLLNQLRAHGIREVAITVSEDGNRSERLFEALAGIKTAEMTIHRHVDDGNRGAAGAIKELESIFGAGPLLVIHPTVWLDGFELEAMWREHQDRGSTVTMLLEPAARYRSDLDRVELDTDGVVKRYSNLHASREKRSHLRPAGVYFMQPEVFDFVEPGRYVDLVEQLLDWLNEDGFAVRGYRAQRPLRRFEDAAQYVELNRQLMLQWWSELDWDRRASSQAPDGILELENARVSPEAVLVGPVVVGPNAVIEAGARVIGPALVCADSFIGEGALVRDSLVWQKSRIGKGASVEYSLITENCRVEPGRRVFSSLVDESGAFVGDLVSDAYGNTPLALEMRGDIESAYPSGVGPRLAYLATKRALDVLVPLLLLPLLAPVLLLTAIAIKLDSRGPVLFKQVRCGRGGHEFWLYKFRTMVVNAEQLYAEAMARNEAGGPMLKLRKDPRTTRIGAFLRRTSLDELPQLWNVLRGDMTLVGPRPLAMREMVWCPRWRDQRLLVKPGLTGLWQISSRGEFSFDGWIEHDIRYVKQQSLHLDLRILLKTAMVLWKRPNAA